MSRQLLVQATHPTPSPAEWELLVPYGRWSHPRYGLVDNSPERVRRYYEHFRRGVKLQGEPGVLPLTLDHDDKIGAAGWITDVRVGAAGLEGLVRFTPQGREAVASESYPFISPDLLDEYTDPQTGEVYQDVLAGASLVVRPYFKSMPQVYLEHYHDAPEPTVLWEDLKELAMATDADEALRPGSGEVRTTPAERPDAATEPEADTVSGSAADTPAAASEEGQGQAQPVPDVASAEPMGFAEPVDAKQFAELRDEVTALRFKERVRQYSDTLDAHQFGDGRRIAPASREALAEALAAIHETNPAQAERLWRAVQSLRTYAEGEAGLDTPARPAKQFSDEDRAFMARHGLSEADYDTVG